MQSDHGEERKNCVKLKKVTVSCKIKKNHSKLPEAVN